MPAIKRSPKRAVRLPAFSSAEWMFALTLFTTHVVFTEQAIYEFFHGLRARKKLAWDFDFQGRPGHASSERLREMLSWMCIGQSIYIVNFAGDTVFRLRPPKRAYVEAFFASREHTPAQLDLLKPYIKEFDALVSRYAGRR